MAPIEIGENLVEVHVSSDDGTLTVELHVYRDGDFIEQHELTYKQYKEWQHDKSEIHR